MFVYLRSLVFGDILEKQIFFWESLGKPERLVEVEYFSAAILNVNRLIVCVANFLVVVGSLK